MTLLCKKLPINEIICGDCLAVMGRWPENSIPAIVTDPPYGLRFMGKKWDYDVPSIEEFEMCLRILKPGGTLLCFAGSRTQHRMAINIEDAGFILKDCIMWLYGSGFPKATDISKQIDKKAGAVREVVGKKYEGLGNNRKESLDYGIYNGPENLDGLDITAPATAEAILWDGWKSHGLKPAYEPIIVAMKPNEGSYAENALKWGVGGLNIAGCKIPFKSEADKKAAVFGRGTDILGSNYVGATHGNGKKNIQPDDAGRFPANIILDEKAAEMLDEQSGFSSGSASPVNQEPTKANGEIYGFANYEQMHKSGVHFGDKGGASRFFYCAKASKGERNFGCEGLEIKQSKGGGGMNNTPDDVCGKYGSIKSPGKNHHPTVKPLALMEYLCKLVATPTGGLIVDPWIGSGTTAIAAINLGREFIGIESEEEFYKIAKKRVEAARRKDNEKFGLFEKV